MENYIKDIINEMEEKKNEKKKKKNYKEEIKSLRNLKSLERQKKSNEIDSKSLDGIDPMKTFLIKPQIEYTEDFEEFQEQNDDWMNRTPTKVCKKPVIEAEVCTSQIKEIVYQTYEEPEIIMEKIRLGCTEKEHKIQKCNLINNLQTILKRLAVTNNTMRRTTEPVECTDLQINQSSIAVVKFKSEYPVESKEDENLAVQI